MPQYTIGEHATNRTCIQKLARGKDAPVCGKQACGWLLNLLAGYEPMCQEHGGYNGSVLLPDERDVDWENM